MTSYKAELKQLQEAYDSLKQKQVVPQDVKEVTRGLSVLNLAFSVLGIALSIKMGPILAPLFAIGLLVPSLTTVLNYSNELTAWFESKDTALTVS